MKGLEEERGAKGYLQRKHRVSNNRTLVFSGPRFVCIEIFTVEPLNLLNLAGWEGRLAPAPAFTRDRSYVAGSIVNSYTQRGQPITPGITGRALN